jgi:hypothetical protein
MNFKEFVGPLISADAARLAFALPEKLSADQTQVGGSHYKDMPMQPWDVMQAVLTPAEFIGFLKGNVIKYSLRAGKKAGADDDAEKAKHYAQKLKEVQGE